MSSLTYCLITYFIGFIICYIFAKIVRHKNECNEWEDVSGAVVLQSELEVAMQDASQSLLVISSIVGLIYISTSMQMRTSPKPKVKEKAHNSYTPKHVMYMGVSEFPSRHDV